MEKPEYIEKLEELNAELEKLPSVTGREPKVVTSGIICDNPKLLQSSKRTRLPSPLTMWPRRAVPSVWTPGG